MACVALSFARADGRRITGKWRSANLENINKSRIFVMLFVYSRIGI